MRKRLLERDGCAPAIEFDGQLHPLSEVAHHIDAAADPLERLEARGLTADTSGLTVECEHLAEGAGMLDFSKFDSLPDDIDGIHFSRKPRTCGLREMPTMADVERFVNARVAEVGVDTVPPGPPPDARGDAHSSPRAIGQGHEDVGCPGPARFRSSDGISGGLTHPSRQGPQ